MSARDLHSGRRFQFQVNDAATLRGLTVGQRVGIDAQSGKVAVNPGDACCGIIQGAAKAGARPADPVNSLR